MWPGVHAKKLCILDATIVLEMRMADEHEWDEKAMFIVVEVDPENDEDEGATNVSTTAAAARIK